MLSWMLAAAAHAATLPGVAVPFEVDDQGRWVLASDLPDPLAQAGAQPGWVLLEVDGVPFEDPGAVQRRIAAGPSRKVQLLFSMVPPDAEAPVQDGTAPIYDETLLVARRAPLVHVLQEATVPWPDGLAAPVSDWREDWTGAPVLLDANRVEWRFDAEAGGLFRTNAEEWSEHGIPSVFWELSKSTWVLDDGNRLSRGNVDWAREQIGDAARVSSFRSSAGEHLVRTGDSGLTVWSVTFPRGVPNLPTCQPRVPETCLTSGMQILDTMGDRTGAPEEALRQLGIACANGVHRACYESVALEEPSNAAMVDRCINGEVTACNSVARDRFEFDPDNPDDLVLGLLEYACELEGSGSLGERLRRLEDVGAGCIMLSEAYDAKSMPDLALLNLDHACVLGRADACEEASERRQAAFAARMVRECEDPNLPIAASCVDLGRLLQETEVTISELDDFDAFLRGCSLGAVDGCILLGDYVDRWGIAHPRVKQAEAQLGTSCAQGNARACVGAAHLLVRHEPRTTAYGEALTLFSGACDEGLGEGCVAGAEQRRIGQARRVEAPSQVDMWNAACDRNTPDGCAGLGDRLAKSRNALDGAFTAYTRACELGHPHSCSELGMLVQRRHTPWEGEEPADSYLRRGCENGDPEGCYWLAEDELPRKGEPAEPTYLLLDQSCEGEYGEGCAELADVHLDRRTSFDDEIAARHLDTACANGFYDSCRILGGMYLRGKGVERDRQRATELLERFRFNAKRKHLRMGAAVGLPYLLGLEGEIVLPIPVGPAISINGHYSYVPLAGGPLYVLDGDSITLANLTSSGFGARLYPNHQARGLYGAVGLHTLTATNNDGSRSRSGWNARVGVRSQTKSFYTSLEIGMGQYGLLDLNDFDDLEQGVFPVILPAVGFSMGLALL